MLTMTSFTGGRQLEEGRLPEAGNNKRTTTALPHRQVRECAKTFRKNLGGELEEKIP